MADTDTAIVDLPTLATLRASGADRADPVRFRYLEALARRADAYRGEARRRLDARLAEALRDYAASAARATPTEPTAATAHAGRASPLAELLAHGLRERSDQQSPASPAVAAQAANASDASLPGSHDELKTLRYFRNDWARLRVAGRFAHELREGPDNAGPLNPHRLVLRALERMNDLSPEYLARFLPYADALLRLGDASESAQPSAGEQKRRKPRANTR